MKAARQIYSSSASRAATPSASPASYGSRRPISRSGRRGSSIILIPLALLALVLVGGGLYVAYGTGTTERTINPIMATVVRGEFVSQVLEQGEVQSSDNVEIRCNVRPRGGSIGVIEVVPEGKQVSAGDFLVRLDSSSFENEREQQRISVSNAQIAVIQAKAALLAAEASLRQYTEGTYVETLKQIENEIYNAQQEVEQAEAYLAHSIRLHKRGFISTQQLNGDEIAVQRARNSLSLAEKKLEVLQNITREKEMVRLESDIEAARVQLANKEETLLIEQQKLQEIQTQIDNCVILVPPGVSGEVVYAKEFDRRGGSEWVLEAGAQVRERQVLIRLPNRKRMEVKTLIKEQSIASVRPGMPARIRVDALNDQTLTGVVVRVNQYAEQSGWMSSGAREYAAFVRIFDPPETLIPGMNASVAIQTLHQRDVLQAPLQCVYAVNDRHFVMRQRGTGWETVEVTVSGDNSQMAWLAEGVEEGDRLVMNPGAYKDMMDLPPVEGDSRIDLPDDDAYQPDDARGVRLADNARGGPGGPEGESRRERRGEGGQERAGGAPGAGGPPGMGNPQAMVDAMFSRYDTDGDGKISPQEMEEVDERARAMLQRADADGDGSVTREEVQRAMQRMMQQPGGPGGPGGGGGFRPGAN